MILANGKGRMSTLAVDDDLDMNGRNVTNADVVSVNEHVTLVGAQRLPGKGFRSTERNGWGVSKDNNDIERKFFKDDFSVDSRELYTGNVADFTWDTANKEIMFYSGSTTASMSMAAPLSQTAYGSKISFSMKRNNINGTYQGGIVIGRTTSTIYTIHLIYESGHTRLFLRGSSDPIGPVCTWANQMLANDTDYHRFDVIIDNQGLIWGYIDGVKSNITVQNVLLPRDCNLQPGIVRFTSIESKTIWLKDFSVSPPISYADNFATDTVSGANGRYQAVTGTVAYDGTNKRMNVTTATGANGKASGRLKSYKFTEGSQIYDVTLPTGADGDFITLVTHSANGLMTDGIGVGLQSDGAGNWNLATLSGTTVTEGADSGLDDADVARIEIEKDVTGAYWYYIYDAAGTKPTTATGKLFTTLTEGYTGWYANGAGAETQTFEIDNISIRAESIVGRTNVQVEEAFWFRDEANVDALERYARGTSWVFDTDHYKISGTAKHSMRTPFKLTNADAEVEVFFSMPDRNSAAYALSISLCDDGSSTLTDQDLLSGNQYKLYVGTTSENIRLTKVVSGVGTTFKTFDFTLIEGTNYKMKFKNTNGVLEGYVAEAAAEYPVSPQVTETDTTFTSGYVKVGRATAGTVAGTHTLRVDDIKITGTRVYNKPIHRGAMLETWNDGTQEVVGTTFVDDCQWDRSAEYNISYASSGVAPTFDTVTGCIRLSNLSATTGIATTSEIRLKGMSMGSGFVYAKVKCLSTHMHGFSISAANVEVFIYSNGATRIYDPTITNIGAGFPEIPVELNDIIEFYITYETGINRTGITIYKNGTFLWSSSKTLSNITLSPSPVGVRLFGYTSIDRIVEVQQFIAIGIDSDATNGIAACIPPIGGGARYGEVEEVYHEYTNEVRKGKYLVSTCVKTTDVDAEAIEMYLENTTDSTAITEDASKTVAIALADTNYMDVEKEMDLGYADRGDTLKVAVRKTSAATEVSPACFVEMLNVTPSVEVI